MRKAVPLAHYMRPRDLSEVVGQQEIIGKDSSLYQAIQNGFVPSMLLYGPPGVGKTSIAHAIAGSADVDVVTLNATTAKKKDIESVVALAKEKGRVILHLEEIHIYSKSQQDVLLSHLETGDLALIGTTTANPFHDVNPAIRSRCQEIKELRPVSAEDIVKVLREVFRREYVSQEKEPILSDDQYWAIAESTNGDVRSALNALEYIIYAAPGKKVTEELIKNSVVGKGVRHDKKGDSYYSLLSAMQKSIRSSDVDAALHYLARLLHGGDLISVCRRLSVTLFEDISIANPQIIPRVEAALRTSKSLGMPEARIPLAFAVVDMSLSPKSNAPYKALDQAMADVKEGRGGEVPKFLLDTHYKGSQKLGHGSGYVYAHNFPEEVFQPSLPEQLKGKQYFQATGFGLAAKYRDRLEYIRLGQKKTGRGRR